MQMKRLIFSLGERKDSGLSALSVLWLAWVVSSAAAARPSNRLFKQVLLHTDPEASAECGHAATLTCNASSLSSFVANTMSWVAPNLTVLCTMKSGKLEGKAACEWESSLNKHSLVLTLGNLTPSQRGQYTCNLRSSLEPKSSTTMLEVPECPPGHHSRNKTHVECVFRGNYPHSVIHWFLEEDNLTQSATTHTEEGPNGSFNVRSALPVYGTDAAKSYKCFLRSLATGNNLLQQQINATTAGGGVGPERVPALCMTVLVWWGSFW